MSTEAQPAGRPKPPPPKKRYSVLLPQELAERFERVAGLRHGSKSAIVEGRSIAGSTRRSTR